MIHPLLLRSLPDFWERADKAVVTEVSIGRIVRHLKTEEGFVLLSASRHERSPAENKEKTAMLASMIRGKGYGYIPVYGIISEKDAEGNDVMVREDSFIVPKMTEKDAIELATLFDQESILLGNKEGVWLVYTSGERERLGDEITTQNISKYYTRYKRHKFTFEALYYKPYGLVDAYGFAVDVYHRMVAVRGQEETDKVVEACHKT